MLRQSFAIRELVEEKIIIAPSDFIALLFITEGTNVKEEIGFECELLC